MGVAEKNEPELVTETRFPVTPHPRPTAAAEREAALQKLAFGTQFTDHMVQISWEDGPGWHNHRVVPYGPLTLDPAAAVLHYGQEIFEGLKAYRHADGSVWLFRPEVNAARFNRSAHRLALPELPVADFLGAVTSLVRTDAAWVPSVEESSLYLRPFMFATEAFLGVRPAREYEFLVIASPVGPYFSGGVKPVAIWVEDTFHRAGPGGTGAAKCGGNYAASLRPQIEAAARGYEQVLYLDAITGTYLEELGGMNVFVVYQDGTVATPRSNGNILEGVTRQSIITVLNQQGRQVAEQDLPLAQLRADIESGAVAEIFACGTAAVVTPVGKLGGVDFELTINGGLAGPITTDVRQIITDIQYGRAVDQFGWMQRVV